MKYLKNEIVINYFLQARWETWVAVISAKNQKRQRSKRQSVPAKREKSQTPKFVTANLTYIMIRLPIIWRLHTLSFAALALAVFGAIECIPKTWCPTFCLSQAERSDSGLKKALHLTKVYRLFAESYAANFSAAGRKSCYRRKASSVRLGDREARHRPQILHGADVSFILLVKI